jgi:nicotinate-nucleotide pyrophosphorylase (carboxylating)
MLDNLSPSELARTAAALKKNASHVLVEASGGITAETVQDYMSPGGTWPVRLCNCKCDTNASQPLPLPAPHSDVDVISTSWIHQGAPHVDFSLKIQPSS